MASGEATITEGFVDVNGARVRYLESGDGFPLVLLHGRNALCSADQWRLNMPALGTVAHVYALDMIGWGKSDQPGAGYSFDLFTEMVRCFLDALGIERADVGGQSLGGWFAALFAHRFPERTRKLLLVGNAGLNMQPPGNPAAFEPPTMEQARDSFKWNFADNVAPTQEMVREVYDLARRPGRAEAYLALIEATHDPEARAANSLADRLPEVTAPSLVVWGSDATGIGLEYGEQAHALLPNSRLVVTKGGSHNAQGITPREFEAATLDFLREPA